MATLANLVVNITGNTGKLIASLKDGESRIDRFARKHKTAMKGIGIGLAASGAAAAASTKLFIEFDSSMQKIVGLVGLSQDAVDGMRKSVLKLAGETAKSPQELADALFAVTSAGLKGDKALATLTASAKAAAAGLGDTKSVALTVVGALQSYRKEGLSAAQATDILTATVRAGNLEAAELASTLSSVIPVAQGAGVSFDELGGAIALISRTGAPTSQIVTGLRAAIIQMSAPTAAAAKELTNAGLSAEILRKTLADDGLIAALRLVEKASAGDASQFRKMLGSVEALTSANVLLGSSADDIAATFGVVANATGATDAAFKVMTETAGFKLQQAFTDLKIRAVEFGRSVAPVVSALAKAFSALPKLFQNVGIAATGMFVAIRVALRSTKAALISSGIGAAIVLIGVAFELTTKKLGLFAGASSEATDKLRILNAEAVEAARIHSDLADRMDELFIAAGRGGGELTEKAAAITSIGESLRKLFTISPGDFMGEGLAATRKQLEDIVKTIDRTGLTFRDLEDVIRQIDTEFSITGARVENFGGIMDALHDNTAKTTETLDASISVWEQVAQAIDDMTTSIGSSSVAVISFDAELELFARKRGAEERLQRLKDQFRFLGEGMELIGEQAPAFGEALRDGIRVGNEAIEETVFQLGQANESFQNLLQTLGLGGKIKKTGARADVQIASFQESLTGGEALKRLLAAIERQARLFQSGRANEGVGGGVLIGGAGKLLGFGQDQATGRLGDADILNSILDRVGGLSDLQIGKIGGLLELLQGQGRGVGSRFDAFIGGSGLGSQGAADAFREFGGSKGDIHITLNVQGSVNGIDDLESLVVQAVVTAKANGATV